MRTPATVLAFSLVAAAMSVTAHAQSRSERTYQNLDRSMQQQQQQQQNRQQNQFELNQMRQGVDRNNLFTPQPVIPGPGFERR